LKASVIIGQICRIIENIIISRSIDAKIKGDKSLLLPYDFQLNVTLFIILFEGAIMLRWSQLIKTLRNACYYFDKRHFIVFSALMASSSAFCQDFIQLGNGTTFIPNRLGNISVLHNDDGFHVLTSDNEIYPVRNYFVDKRLRGLKKEKLKAFLQAGYIQVNQMSDGQYKLDAKVRGLGGGPICGMVAYWATKLTCYAFMGAAAKQAIVSTGVSIGGTFGGEAGAEIGAAVGGMVGTAGNMAMGGMATAGAEGLVTAPIGMAAGTIIGDGILSSPVVAQAVTNGAQVVGGVMTAAHGSEAIGATIAVVETVSAVVGGFFSGPWCP